jgi:hypothetical protein
MSPNDLLPESRRKPASAFDHCVKERAALHAWHVQLSFMKLFSVLLAVVLGTGVATVANAQNPPPQITDIHAFVACLNSITKTNQTVVDAVKCVPPGSFYTVTMSPFSAQRACTKDGVQLPRVIFSSPGPGAGLRFRPSFTLCPSNGLIDHIEVGEDVNSSHDQKMGDIASPPEVPNFMSITEFGTGAAAVVSTIKPANDKGCTVPCHGNAGTFTTAQGQILQLSSKIFPSDFFLNIVNLAPFVLDTNDPDVIPSSTPTPLSAVCAAIESSTALASDANVDLTKEIQLCERLLGKISGN